MQKVIDYEEVYQQTGKLRERIEQMMSQVGSDYSALQHTLDGADGKTNAALKENAELQKNKSLNTAEALLKLLTFMSDAAKQAELHDDKIARDIASKGSEGGEQ